MIKIAPSILSADFSRLKEEITSVKSAEYIHLDIMDGRFVPNITFGPVVIKSIRQHSNQIFDTHLMIEEPERYIEEFARAYILDEIPAGSKIIPNTLQINYRVVEKNLEEGKIDLELDISAKTYKDIKEAIIKKGLIGKTVQEAEMFLKNQEEVKNVKVNLWPFWVKQIPGNKNKIKVELTLD